MAPFSFFFVSSQQNNNITKEHTTLKTMKQMDLRVGIIATGWIAEKAAYTLQRLEGVTCRAVASRSIERA